METITPKSEHELVDCFDDIKKNHGQRKAGNEVCSSADSRHLFKKVLAAEMREEVLARLGECNINSYTLFGSEDSLIKTMENQLFDIEDWCR